MEIDRENCLVLIVEDELIIAEHISRILKSAGYRKSNYVTNADDAIAFLQQNSVDIVLTDIMIEGHKNGIDLGARIHSDFSIPFIYITSHSSRELVDNLMKTRPNAYLLKPFKKEDLIVAIELALFNSKASESEQTLQIKDGHAYAQIPFDDILWIEAEGNYSVIHSKSSKRRLIRSAITELFNQLPEETFIRIHRSYIVNKKMITSYTSSYVVVAGNKLTVGRTFKDQIMDNKRS